MGQKMAEKAVNRTAVKRRGRFASDVMAALSAEKILRIRAGTKPHRLIGIWFVMVENRLFVRSWSLKPQGWFRTIREEPRAEIQVGGHQLTVRAVHTRSERLVNAVSRAYLQKYNTGGSIKYARDLGRPKSRATTTELLPE